MTSAAATWPDLADVRSSWSELGPLLRRVVRSDAASIARVRVVGDRVSVFAVLGTGALVGRAVGLPEHQPAFDATAGAAELLAWLEAERSAPPVRVDEKWLSALPPIRGWRRVDAIPDAVVREVLRQGAAAHLDAANLDLGAKAAQNLLDTPVLTVSGGDTSTELTNRSLSALTAMGFLPAGGLVIVAVSGRWTRVAALHGSVYVQNQGGGLGLL